MGGGFQFSMENIKIIHKNSNVLSYGFTNMQWFWHIVDSFTNCLDSGQILGLTKGLKFDVALWSIYKQLVMPDDLQRSICDMTVKSPRYKGAS